MIHIHQFITRKEPLTEAAFHRYWHEMHGPIAGRIKQLRMYLQSHRIPYAGANSSYDGAAEALFDSLDGLAEMRKSPDFIEGALADGSNFIDPNRVEFMATRDHVIIEGPTGSPLVKGVYQLKRMPGMALQEFRKYWIEVHGRPRQQASRAPPVCPVAPYRRSLSLCGATVRWGRAAMVR